MNRPFPAPVPGPMILMLLGMLASCQPPAAPAVKAAPARPACHLPPLM